MKNILLAITSLILLNSCGNKKSEEQPRETKIDNTTTLTDAQIKNAGIELGSIEQKEISETLS